MAEKSPKMEFQTNIPANLKLVKMFSKGEGTYGPWWAWEVEHDGVKKTLFTDDRLQGELEAAGGAGATLIITKEELKSESGKPYHFFTVRTALFDKDGNQPARPEPNIAKDPKAYESYREDRTNKLTEAIEDVVRAVARVDVVFQPQFTSEDIRAMAISLMIQFDKRAL